MWRGCSRERELGRQRLGGSWETGNSAVSLKSELGRCMGRMLGE